MTRWLIAAIVLGIGLSPLWTASAIAGGNSDKEASYIKVKVKGKLVTGIIAIGGETTGAIVKTKDGVLELDFGKNKKMRELATKLDKKNVFVEGRLTIRKGVEVRLRIIVAVTALKSADK